MKRLMFFLMAIVFAIQGWSQEIIQIGTGTTNSSSYIPWYYNYNNTYSQQLFTAAEIIAANGGTTPTNLTMTSLAWNFTATTTRQYIHILIGSTAATTLSAWVAPTSFVEVYSSQEETFNPGWNFIDFDSSFVWDGTSNIVVTVISYFPYGGSTPHASSCAQSSATSMSRYHYTDGTTGVPYYSTTANPTSAGTSVAYRNTTKFVFDVPPTCLRPQTVAMANITTTSADISWTQRLGSPGSEWEIQYKPASDTSWSGASVVTENAYSSPYTLVSTLNANTAYDIRIREICGVGSDVGIDFSNWVTTSFRTACDYITTLPFTENFDAYGTGTATYSTFIPCWNKLTTYTDRPYLSNTYYHSAPASVYFYAGSGTYNIAITPPFDASIPVNTLMATFWYRTTNPTDRLIVGVMTDPTNATTFVPVDTVTTTTTATWENIEVPLASYTGTGQYIAFKNEYTTATGYGYVDDLVIDIIPACTRPSGIVASNISSTGADISWTSANVSDIGWNFLYKESTATSYDTVYVTSSPYTLTGLTPNTQYDVIMLTECSDGSFSNPAIYTFRTACGYITTFPWMEDFESSASGSNLAAIPSCWARNTNYSIAYYPYVSSSSSTAYSGSQYLYFAYGSSTYHTAAIAPPIDPSIDITTLRVKFKMRYSTIYSATGLQLGIMTDPTDWSTFVPVGPRQVISATNTWQDKEVSLASYVPTDTNNPGNYIALATIGDGAMYAYVDNFIIEELPTCPDIYNATVTAQSSSAILVSWANMGEDVEIVYGDAATFNLATNTWDNSVIVPTGTTLPYVLNGLSAQTTYKVALRHNCGGEWSNVLTVTTFPTMTAGIEEWRGYMFNLISSPQGTWGSTYYGFVTEPAIFTRDVGSGVWTGTTDSLTGTLPTDYFAVRYLMTKTVDCGYYEFKVSGNSNGVDDLCRFTLDGGLTWVIPGPWTSGWTGVQRGQRYLDAGTHNFQLDYGELTGTAAVAFDFYPVAMPFATTVTPFTIDIHFPDTITANWTQWNVMVSSTPLTDPYTETGDIINITTTSNPYTVTGLTSETQYYIYARPATACVNDTLWGSRTATTGISCPVPTNLSVPTATLTTTSATVTWTDALLGSEYIIEWKQSAAEWGDDPTLSDVVYQGTQTYTILNLSPSSSYNIRIRTVCNPGDSSSSWATVNFMTICGAITSLPWGENFDTYGSSALPACWSTLYTYSLARPITTATYAHSGTYSLYFYAGTTAGVYDMGIMPAIDASIPINTLRLKFYGRGQYVNNKLVIGAMTDPTNATTFVGIDTVTITTASVWDYYEISLSDYTGTGQYIAFKTDAASNTYGYFYLDDLVVDEIPACSDMYNFTVSAGPDATSFNLSWTEMGEDVEIIYGDATTFDITNPATYYITTVTTGTTLPYTISGLAIDATYKIAARHTCGINGNGTWSSLETVATPPTEVYGTDQWIGYVYNAPTIYQPQTYLGQVIEPAQFTKASTTSAWTGSITSSWIYPTAAPSDRFFVRYMMTTDFTCGTYKFQLNNVDDVARLSIDGGATWLIEPANWGTAIQNGSFTASTTLTDGTYNLIIEYYEVTGSAALAFAYEIMPMEITVNSANTTTNSVEIGFPANSGTSWSVMVSTTPVSPLNQSSTGNVENSTGITTNPYTITGLTANTTYYIYAHPESACDNDTLWGNITAQTNCAALSLPFTEDFESYTGTAYNVAGVLPDCWKSYTNNTTYPAPHITGSGSFHYPHSGSKTITFTTGTTGSGTDAYLVLPAFDTSIEQLRMSFWYRFESSAYGELQLGYITGGQSNIGSFTRLTTLPHVTTHTQFNYDFSTSTDTNLTNATYIALKYISTGTYYSLAVDDFYVEEAPVCPDVSGFVASVADAQSINVSWTDLDADVQIVYGDPATFDLTTDTWDTSVTVLTGSTLPYNLSGLTPSTSYSIAIRNLCGSNGGDGTWSNVITLTTGIVEVSPVDSWNGYVYTSPTICNPTSYLGMVTETTPQFTRNVGNDPWTGVTETWVNGDTIGPANNFFVRYRMTTNFTCGTYQFSLTNVDDLARLSIDGGITWLVQPSGWGTVIQNGTITGTTYLTSGTYDLVLEYYEASGAAQVGISWTVQPIAISASNVTSTSFNIEFPTTSASSWALKVSSTPLTDPNTETGDIEDLTVTNNPYTVTGINAQTTYYVYAHPLSSCANDTLWGSKQVTTPCDPIPLPYAQDFEYYAGTTYNAAGVVPACWKSYTNNTTYPAPHITGSGSYWYPHSGSKVLTFTTGTAGADAYAVLPAFDTTIKDLMITFWYRYENASYGKLIVGYLTGSQTDISTFVGLDTCAGTNTLTEHEYSFQNSTDPNLINASFIALKWYYDASYYSCGVDDILVELTPDCPSIKNVSISAIDTTNATVNFNANGNTNWEYVYGEASSVTDPDLETPITSTSNPISLTGLTPNTTYNVWIRSTCTNGSGYGNWTPVKTFTTVATCLPVTALTVTGVTNDEVTISWASSLTTTCSGYNIEYDTAGFTQGTGTIDFVTDTTLTIQGLNAGTTYTFYVQSDCAGDLGPWISVNATTRPDPVILPYFQDFDGGGTAINEWEFIRPTVNAWYIGSATGNTGNSLYISNDNGLTNAYTVGTATYAYAVVYVDFGNYLGYNLSFDWKSMGETGNYDYLNVYILPYTTTIPTNAFPTGGTLVAQYLKQQSAWQHASYTFDSTYANSIRKVVFVWRNDGTLGTQPPAAVDNISITGANCLQPTGVTATLNTSDNQSVDISWTAGNASDANWIIYFKKSTEDNTMWVPYPTNGNPTTISGLDYASTYNFYVTTDCDGSGGGNESFASSTVNCIIPAAPIPCNPPTGLLSSTTSNSATITWTAGTATSWDVVLQDTVSGTPVPVTSATYTFTGLNASTPYFAYVRTNCGSGNYSSWVLRQFTTDANPVTCAAPTGIASTETQTSAT
ncbi:MAG: fibronectin type III domain-containing protein, partial [Bacteroidales bacterium]|nr:fibronectin type III domain-containing protein [Bacteroidales bacterium]